MVITTDTFEDLALSSAEAFGLKSLRTVVLPHPVNVLDSKRLGKLANEAVASIAQSVAEG